MASFSPLVESKEITPSRTRVVSDEDRDETLVDAATMDFESAPVDENSRELSHSGDDRFHDLTAELLDQVSKITIDTDSFCDHNSPAEGRNDVNVAEVSFTEDENPSSPVVPCFLQASPLRSTGKGAKRTHTTSFMTPSREPASTRTRVPTEQGFVTPRTSNILRGGPHHKKLRDASFNSPFPTRLVPPFSPFGNYERRIDHMASVTEPPNPFSNARPTIPPVTLVPATKARLERRRERLNRMRKRRTFPYFPCLSSSNSGATTPPPKPFL